MKESVYKSYDELPLFINSDSGNYGQRNYCGVVRISRRCC